MGKFRIIISVLFIVNFFVVQAQSEAPPSPATAGGNLAPVQNLTGGDCQIGNEAPISFASLKKTNSDLIVGAIENCENSGKTVAVSCEFGRYSPQLGQILNAFASGALDAKKACEDAKKLNEIAAVVNGAFAIECGRSTSSCVNKCQLALRRLSQIDRELSDESSRIQAQIDSSYSAYMRDIEVRKNTRVAEEDNAKKTQDAQLAAQQNRAQAGLSPTELEIVKGLFEREKNDAQTQKDACEQRLREDEAKIARNISTKQEEIETKVQKCDQLSAFTGQMGMEALQSYARSMQAKNCVDFFDQNRCELAEDISKPRCAHMCLPGGKFYGQTQCTVDCNAPANYGSLYCKCKTNQYAAGCPNYTPPGSTTGLSTGGSSGITSAQTTGANLGGNGLTGNFTNDELQGALDLGGAGTAGEAGGGTSAGTGTGAGNYQPGAGGPSSGGYKGDPSTMGGKGGGQGKGPHNTDILHGAATGQGGGGGGNFGSGERAGDRNSKYNLRDYMPGGKGANRTLAGKLEEMERNGVSGAQGLSNFEKVTRQVNEMRKRKEVIEAK